MIWPDEDIPGELTPLAHTLIALATVALLAFVFGLGLGRLGG